MKQLILGFLETSKNDLMIRDEFVTEISSLIDGINGLVNFFLHNMIKHGPWVSSNDNLFLELHERVFTVRCNFHEIVVRNTNLTELLSEILCAEDFHI